MLPYAEDHLSLLWKYQQDNDLKHTAKIAKDWFRQNHVDLLDWPPWSPDLNPIENFCQDVKLRIRCVEEVWNHIPVERCQHLIDSMPRRCAAVIKVKEYPTKY
ncbi:hypothetical protein Trydic_g15011 [Trypoxylus dichotomus]